jgi:hypothetical protein
MEVHHHPQVEKKGFKEYLLEGLMIFLAVTMGFFAESLREHISNKDKTAEYMKSLLIDMKTDTTSINQYLSTENEKEEAYKTLLGYLKRPLQHDTTYLSKFYKVAFATIGRNGMGFTDRIISQLKNSDNFRLIESREVVDAITEYSGATTYYNYLSNLDDHYTGLSQDQARLMINFGVYAGPIGDGKRGIDNSIDLISTDPHVIQQYVNSIYLREEIEGTMRFAVEQQKKRAIALIALLKREYKLE